jgi:hypothetical protein
VGPDYIFLNKSNELWRIEEHDNTHMSLCFLLTFLESRDEIPFKGVELSHPEISNFRM